jgi:hypothetical protein
MINLVYCVLNLIVAGDKKKKKHLRVKSHVNKGLIRLIFNPYDLLKSIFMRKSLHNIIPTLKIFEVFFSL